MEEVSRVVIPAGGVQSLCWDGDDLVDWVQGGLRYHLDGTAADSHIRCGYRFDRATTSPDGQYAAIYECLGTKALLLKGGEFLREMNRSYYCADVYEYPIVVFSHRGRTLVAHCPEEYNTLEIEDAETGERLTRRPNKPMDFFHSRLSVSPDGRYLMSAGWMWHPFNAVLVFDIGQALTRPEVLDAEDITIPGCTGVELNNAAFHSNDGIVVTGDDAFYNPDALEDCRPRPHQIGLYSLNARRYESVADLSESVGTLMPVGDHVVGFFEHPKLIELATGSITARWPELATGRQNSSIIHHLEKTPPLALDPVNRRFAAADAQTITVIQLG